MHRCLIIFALLIVSGVSAVFSDIHLISKADLIEDTRTLVRTIENVHPDPYLRGGGKIAFHRLFQETLKMIPDAGMTSDDFRTLLHPLIASVGDGHTALFDQPPADPYAPGGIPLYFEVYDEGLYVIAVLRENHRDLLGARLVAVEDIPFRDLAERYSRLRGADNKYQLYRNLGGQGVLWRRDLLKAILPEWPGGDAIKVRLRLPDDSFRDINLEIPNSVDFTSFIMPSTIDMQLMSDYMMSAQKTDIFYRFLDDDRETCWLVMRDLSTYREAFEAWQSLKITGRAEQARAVYQRYHGTAAPDDIDAVIAGLPSATELLRSMAQEMKTAGTKNLLIDVSQDGGGSSLISDILLYFLYGKDAVLSLRGRTTEIKKYSAEYFDKFPVPTLRDINADQPIALTENDYDLSGDHGYRGYHGRDYVAREVEEVISWMPTFEAEYDTGTYGGYYRPDNIMVLCDAGTYSSAFFVMYYLKKGGAEIVGMPSAQAGNCFGDIMSFTLPHSKLEYNVSRKYFELFPDDSEKGRVLMPDHLMTYDIMASYDFDPAMLLRFALGELRKR